MFDPSLQNNQTKSSIQSIKDEIESEIDNVVNLDDDRVYRKYYQVIQATLRTNYFQIDQDTGREKEYISFKFAPRLITDIPKPVPKREIFVYSKWLEGTHLRFDLVARGGLRWSDREEDYRTEVLGLAKAQQVKNAIIIPSGAKGGFITKGVDSVRRLML